MNWVNFIIVCMLCILLPTAILLYLQAFNKECIKCRRKRDADKLASSIQYKEQNYEQQCQQLQDTVNAEDTMKELSKNEITFLANKQTIELTNIISNIVAKEFNSSIQDYGNHVEEFVQESVDEETEQQASNVPVQRETSTSINDVDLNQYHAYNNEYNEPTYKKPSPVVSVGYIQYDRTESMSTTVNSTVHEVVQDSTNKNTQGCSTDIDNDIDLKEKLRIERNREYLRPNRNLTPEYRYNYYINQLANKHGQYIEFKLKLNRTIRLAKEVGLTDEIIDDLLVNGNRDKYLLTGVNKYE